jgi:Short C-terminal domain
VDTAGNLAIGKRATLTRMATGGLLLGPLGAVIGGAGFKKDKQYDTWELYLLVEAPEFESIGEFEPQYGAQVREFAVDVHNAYRAWQRMITPDKRGRADEIEAPAKVEPIEQTKSAPMLPAAIAQLSVADELSKLVALKEEGILTEEEFATQKAKLLGR